MQWLAPVIPTTWEWRLGEWQLEDDLGKKSVRSNLNKKKLGLVAHACHPNYVESISRITVLTGLGKNATPSLKNNQNKKGQEHG
jgi:hypothetical protein